MPQNRALVAFLLTLAFQAPVSADVAPQAEIKLGLEHILANLGDPQVAKGAVIASPSRAEPDYYYHWVRDAGLTVATLTDHLPRYPQLGSFIRDWVDFERLATKGTPGLGEPKYHVNGEVFRGPWGRPQNDGPAIRAWAFLRAFGMMDPLVRNDLDYLRGHWRQADFDLWEEVKGRHFFSRYAQMASFRTAAAVAARTDPASARVYLQEAQAIEESLSAFIDPARFIVVPTIGHEQGPQKPAGLDISVVLAPLYFGAGQYWSPGNSYVMATALRLEEAFRALYPVNRQYADLAPGIGRYVEDVYDGTGFSQGHAWFLATFGLAEYYCSLVQEFAARGSIRFDAVNAPVFRAVGGRGWAARTSGIAARGSADYAALMSGLQAKAQSFLSRALFHGGADRRYSEQFDRVSGYRRGARDLTWSYAASVRAFQRCESSAALLQPPHPSRETRR